MQTDSLFDILLCSNWNRIYAIFDLRTFRLKGAVAWQKKNDLLNMYSVYFWWKENAPPPPPIWVEHINLLIIFNKYRFNRLKQNKTTFHNGECIYNTMYENKIRDEKKMLNVIGIAIYSFRSPIIITKLSRNKLNNRQWCC